MEYTPTTPLRATRLERLKGPASASLMRHKARRGPRKAYSQMTCGAPEPADRGTEGTWPEP